jgi:hypothetical protein
MVFSIKRDVLFAGTMLFNPLENIISGAQKVVSVKW